MRIAKSTKRVTSTRRRDTNLPARRALCSMRLARNNKRQYSASRISGSLSRRSGGTYPSEWMKDRPTLDIPTTMPKIQIKINNGSAQAVAGCTRRLRMMSYKGRAMKSESMPSR